MTVFNKEYAKAYDYLYQDKNYEKECDYIEALFSKHYSGKVKRILDLGCGTGGHALILAKRGYEIVGVDRSSEMLAIAQKRVSDAKLPVKLIKGDIINIELVEKFDAVIAMFAVMSYQTSNGALSGACKSAKEHLVPGGIFLFDCWHGSAVLAEKPQMRVKKVNVNADEKIIRFTEPVIDYFNQTVEVRFKVQKTNQGRLANEIEESHLMRYLFPKEIRYFLETAGFTEINFCPFLKAGELLTEKDWNMTVIAVVK